MGVCRARSLWPFARVGDWVVGPVRPGTARVGLGSLGELVGTFAGCNVPHTLVLVEVFQRQSSWGDHHLGLAPSLAS